MKKWPFFIALPVLFMVTIILSSARLQTSGISGTWVLDVKTAQGNGKPRFKLMQEHDTIISGTYSGQFGTAPVTGKIFGQSFSFGYTIRDITVEYVGILDGNKMSGKSIYGDLGEGRFTGKRVKGKSK